MNQLNIQHGRYQFIGNQEVGIHCVFTRKGKRAAGEYVVGCIQGRVFKRLSPEGWREQDSDRLSLVQTRAGFYAFLLGLNGPE